MQAKRPNEADAWTVAIGNLPSIFQALNPKIKRQVDEALAIIKAQDGFIGVFPQPPDGTLCLFRSKNEAIRAKNIMSINGIQTGNNICHVYIDKKYLKGDNDVST